MLIAHAALASLITLAGAGLHPEAEALTGKGDPGQGARFGIVPTSGMMLLSHLDISELDPQFGSFSANDCWGYVTPTGREIAIIGLRFATAFVDITNPYQPEIVASFESPGSLWRDIKILDDHAYAVSEGGGHIQVFDLSQADAGTVIDLGFTALSGRSSTHNLVINEDSGYLYRVGAWASIQAYSVGARGLPGSPMQPVETLIDPGFYVHDAQVVTYDTGPYAGREIAFLCTGRGPLRIWDLTDKQNPFEISSLDYPGRGYNHQGWLDEERRYFYINDEFNNGGGTKMFIIDVEDLENPVFVQAWLNGGVSDAHNLYVKGDRVYASNYTMGLRVHDITDRENPAEIAWIDTFPQRDRSGYDGAWSNYPYFPSGNVIISDIQSGLFIARLDADSIQLEPAGTLPVILNPAGGDSIRLTIASGQSMVDPATAELVLVEDTGTETRTAGAVVDGVLEFITPPIECGRAVSWWIEVQDTTGMAFGYPAPFGVDPIDTVSAVGFASVFVDDAETDPGWRVRSVAADGGWSRGVPVDAGRGDPSQDADGSGSAWLTDNSSSNGGNSDVDGGSTTLTSPVLGPAAQGTLEFSYWLSDTDSSPFSEGDQLAVLVNELDGLGWRTVRTYTEPDGAWRTDRLMPGADLPDSGTFRVRFKASDLNGENVVEAGIDAIVLRSIQCDGCANPADTNGDGSVSPADYNAWILAFNNQDPACDQNGDGLCTPADYNAWILNYNDGC